MTITRIEVQQKNKSRYSIYVDGKYSFSLSDTSLLSSGLHSGMDVTNDRLETLKRDSDYDKIYMRSIELIMRRPRSEWEIVTYLKNKKIEQEIIDRICSDLRPKGYIDDYDFATRWVDNRRLLKNTSRRKLILELKQKRVSETIINQVLENDEGDEVAILKNEIKKKRSQTRYQDKDKLMQYLMRQGYGYGDVKEALADYSD